MHGALFFDFDASQGDVDLIIQKNQLNAETTVPTGEVVVDAAPVNAAPPTPGVAMATSVVIEETGSGTSTFVYLLIMIAILLIVFAPPIIAARQRPSVKI
jgi:hypothetical protein